MEKPRRGGRGCLKVDESRWSVVGLVVESEASEAFGEGLLLVVDGEVYCGCLHLWCVEAEEFELCVGAVGGRHGEHVDVEVAELSGVVGVG